MGIFSRPKRIRGKDCSFFPREPVESPGQLSCPGCGLFAMYTLKPEEEPDMEKLHWCMANALVLVFFQIGHYREKPLDEAALCHMDRVLGELEASDKDVILRVAYDNTGQGLAHEPGDFEQILDHIDQLSGLLSRYRESILLFQGLLLGSWGEMHSSRYLGTDRMARLVPRLREALGEGPYMAFRRPTQYRRLYQKVARSHRTGLFDDGILGSDDDLGTFGIQGAIESGWTGPWSKKEELAFIGELSRYAPVGGEAVLGDHKRYPYSIGQTIAHLKSLHVSYLNSEYDTRVYAAWEQESCGKKGPWKEVNGKDYIFRHLGYRLRLAELSGSVRGEELTLSLVLTNDGFARPYRRLSPRLVLGEQEAELSGRLSELAPGKTAELTGQLPMIPGNVYLVLSADRDRPVPLANAGGESGRLLIGEIRR